MRTDLEQALLRDRDDARLWAVYADWLESEGDVRGALSSLMLKREAAPSRAMEESFQAQAPLLASLTPTSLETLATRGSPRLAPVFRRGFLFSAGATQLSDFEALVKHPSAAFLDTVLLESEELAEWFSTVTSPLPWRTLEVSASQLDLGSLAPHLPFLHTLRLEVPCDELAFGELPSLKCVRLRGPSEENLNTLLEAELPALEVIELLAPRDDVRAAPDLDGLVALLAPRVPKLSRVVLEGAPGPATARLVEQHRNVFVRPTEPLDRFFPVEQAQGTEASFAVLRGALNAEHLETLTAFGKLVGAKRLTVTQSVLRLGSAPLTVLQLNGEGEVPFVPRTAVQQLAKKDRALDAVAFTVSQSNDVASAWSVGPHVAAPSEAKKRNVMPISRRDDSAYSRWELTRSVLGALAGLDPGRDALEDVLDALELGTTHVLIGPPLERGQRLPLFTDFTPAPLEDEEDEYAAEEEDEEDEEIYGSEQDEPDPVDPWGAAPVNVPDYGPVEATAPDGEDEPDEDLDPPLHDASSADEEEIWTEGPVELPEHHDSLPGDRIVEPELELMDRPDTLPCPRCHQHAETERCSLCLEEVCRACAGPTAWSAWDAQLAFSCVQCEPLVPGRFVSPQSVRPSPRPSPEGRGSQ